MLPVVEPDTKSRCFLLLFHEPKPRREMPRRRRRPTGASPEDERLQELERELTVTKEYLQSTIEELESANEELKSSNEELQSSNEELQSTNEELETSKEELQSSNEELTTVNDELQNRMAELQQTNDDLHNVLGGIGEAIVIVGMDLRIRRYTHSAEKLLNLVPGDIGRSVSQLNAFIVGHRIEELAARVIDNLAPVDERSAAPTSAGTDLRVTPYRTLDHSIKGALIVLTAADEGARSAAGATVKAEGERQGRGEGLMASTEAAGKRQRRDDARRLAGASLRARAGEARRRTRTASAARLLHDLEVHQVELEMQNQELRAAQPQLEESRARLADLYDFAPVVYVTLGRGGPHRRGESDRRRRYFGVERGNLVGKFLTGLVAGVRRAHAARAHPALLRRSASASRASCRSRCAAGPPVTAQMVSVPFVRPRTAR